MKLGKQAPRHDARTLQFADYLSKSFNPPPTADYTSKVPKWGMMKNDTIGDCTCAAAGHLIMAWTANAGKEFIPSDADVVKMYSAITGYNPATGENDNGANELDVLNYLRKHGLSGHKIEAHASISVKNLDHVRAAVFLFEGVYIGVALPLSAQTQEIWDVPATGLKGKGAPGSWGGHAVPVLKYDAQYVYVITWGEIKKLTWAFWNAYVDEVHAIISSDYVAKNIKAVNGFDLATLQSDMKQI